MVVPKTTADHKLRNECLREKILKIGTSACVVKGGNRLERNSRNQHLTWKIHETIRGIRKIFRV